MGLPIIKLDECSINLTARMRKVWALKGSNPMGLIKYSLKRIHIIGAFSNNILTINYAERVDSGKIIESLEYLKINYKRFILVMDNAGWHRSKEVKDYLNLNKDKIFVEYLPPYSPELNPTETCWRIMRKDVTNNNLFDNLDALKQGINNFVQEQSWNINVFNYLCR